jgi:hypothetical protein
MQQDENDQKQRGDDVDGYEYVSDQVLGTLLYLGSVR